MKPVMFTLINYDRWLYGWFADVASYRVECVRAEAGEWLIYVYEAGVMIREWSGAHAPFQLAMAGARRLAQALKESALRQI